MRPKKIESALLPNALGVKLYFSITSYLHGNNGAFLCRLLTLWEGSIVCTDYFTLRLSFHFNEAKRIIMAVTVMGARHPKCHLLQRIKVFGQSRFSRHDRKTGRSIS